MGPWLVCMDPGGGKITLDQESFRALASDVRVEVLKRLDARRETVTDLSNLLGLSKPTLLEHLEKLQSAGLVKRVDEGRKWIYYELTDKGRKMLHPERVAITLALGAAVVLAAIGASGSLRENRYERRAPSRGCVPTSPQKVRVGGPSTPGPGRPPCRGARLQSGEPGHWGRVDPASDGPRRAGVAGRSLRSRSD